MRCPCSAVLGFDFLAHFSRYGSACCRIRCCGSPKCSIVFRISYLNAVVLGLRVEPASSAFLRDPSTNVPSSLPPMQAEMSAVFQQAEWREKLKPKLPKPSFGASKGGCVNSPSCQNMPTAGDHSDTDENGTKGSAHWHHLHDQSCLVGASLVGRLAASCFTEPGLQRVWWEEGQHYSFPYCHCCHLGPEFDCSPSVGSTMLAPCFSRILAPTSDLPAPSEIFGSLLKLLSSRSSEPINHDEHCTVCKEMELPSESRLSAPDLVAPVPKIVDATVDLPGHRNHWPGVFPQLDAGGLNREPPQSNGGLDGAGVRGAPLVHGGHWNHVQFHGGLGTQPGHFPA